MSVQCFPDNIILETSVAPATEKDMMIVQENVQSFSAICSLIMMVLIYNSVNEMELYIRVYNSRQWSQEAQGHFIPSYPNKFSHITNCLIFTCNFGVFMIYFQLGLMSWSFSMPF
jgi:hypothetical protein